VSEHIANGHMYTGELSNGIKVEKVNPYAFIDPKLKSKLASGEIIDEKEF